MIAVKRCTECAHIHLEHDRQVYKGRSCSAGYCPCGQVYDQVVESGTDETIPTWPAPPTVGRGAR